MFNLLLKFHLVLVIYIIFINLYLGIDLWLEFVQFSIGCMFDKTGPLKIRELMERALGAGGLHVPNGNVLFEVYNEFEKLILMSLKVE